MIPENRKKEVARAKLISIERGGFYLKPYWWQGSGGGISLRLGQTLAHLHHAPRPMDRAIGSQITPPFSKQLTKPKAKPYGLSRIVYGPGMRQRPAKTILQTRKHYAAAICIDGAFRRKKIAPRVRATAPKAGPIRAPRNQDAGILIFARTCRTKSRKRRVDSMPACTSFVIQRQWRDRSARIGEPRRARSKRDQGWPARFRRGKDRQAR